MTASRSTRLFAVTGLAALARRLVVGRRGRFAVMFHGVASRPYPELPAAVVPSFTADGLDRALGWIGERFGFLTPDEFLDGDSGSGPGVLLTFDDGFANNLHQALPVLEKHGAPGLFFVTLQHVHDPRDWLPPVRRAMAEIWDDPADVPEPVARDLFDGLSTGELTRLADHPLATVGAHSVSHPFLDRLDDTELERELAESRGGLTEIIGRPVDLFAYPTGAYDERVSRATASAGYRAAFADRPVGVGCPAYEIPRVGLYDADPAYLAAKLSGLHRRPWTGVLP